MRWTWRRVNMTCKIELLPDSVDSVDHQSHSFRQPDQPTAVISHTFRLSTKPVYHAISIFKSKEISAPQKRAVRSLCHVISIGVME